MISLSYSRINDYEICPRRFHHKHILRDVPYEESPAMAQGSAVHEAIKDRLHGVPLPEGMPYEYLVQAVEAERGDRTLLCEHQLGMKQDGQPCDFHDPDVYLRGIIDLCITDYQCAWIGDWKTGKVRENPTELKIHAVLLRAAFPSLSSITGNYIWLNEKRVGQAWDLSDTNQTWDWISTLSRHIEANGVWSPNKGPLCAWCPVTREQCEFRR